MMTKEVLSAGEHFLPALLLAATKEMPEDNEIIHHVSSFGEASAEERWDRDPYTRGGYIQNPRTISQSLPMEYTFPGRPPARPSCIIVICT
jgi:hypothetical protein